MPHPPTDPTIEQKYMGIVFGAQMKGFSGEILNSFTPTSSSYCGYNRNPTKMGLVFHSTWHLRIVGRCRRLVVKLASAFFFSERARWKITNKPIVFQFIRSYLIVRFWSVWVMLDRIEGLLRRFWGVQITYLCWWFRNTKTTIWGCIKPM